MSAVTPVTILAAVLGIGAVLTAFVSAIAYFIVTMLERDL